MGSVRSRSARAHRRRTPRLKGNLMDSERRVVAILGAGGTLGTALARQFAGEPGTDLVLSDLSEAAVQVAAAGLPDPTGQIELMAADVSDFAQVEAVVTRA